MRGRGGGTWRRREASRDAPRAWVRMQRDQLAMRASTRSCRARQAPQQGPARHRSSRRRWPRFERVHQPRQQLGEVSSPSAHERAERLGRGGAHVGDGIEEHVCNPASQPAGRGEGPSPEIMEHMLPVINAACATSATRSRSPRCSTGMSSASEGASMECMNRMRAARQARSWFAWQGQRAPP